MSELSLDFYKKALEIYHFLDCKNWELPLLKKAYEYLKNPLILSDCFHRLLYEYHETPVQSENWNRIIKERNYPLEWINKNFHKDVDLLAHKSTVIHSLYTGDSAFVGSIIRKNICYGFFSVLEENQKVSYEDKLLISVICEVLSVRMSESKEYSVLDSFYGPLLSDILENKISNHKELRKRMATRNWLPQNNYQFFMAKPSQKENSLPVTHIIHHLSELSPQIFSAEYLSDIIILTEASSEKNLDILYSLLVSQANILHITIAGSDIFHDLLDLPYYYTQVSAIFSLSKNPRTDSEVFLYRDFRFLDFLTKITHTLPCDNYYHRDVLYLAQYDKDHHSALSQTLFCYLKHGKNVSECCKELYLHRNTIDKHLNKIKAIINCDFSDPFDTLHMLMTYILLDVQKQSVRNNDLTAGVWHPNP